MSALTNKAVKQKKPFYFLLALGVPLEFKLKQAYLEKRARYPHFSIDPLLEITYGKKRFLAFAIPKHTISFEDLYQEEASLKSHIESLFPSIGIEYPTPALFPIMMIGAPTRASRPRA